MGTKISVIVPVYNTYDELRRCLDSLVAQTLEDIEILVVNDGSPDNSQEIIDEFVLRYPKKVKGLLKENGGLSDARNYGVKRAKGEYLSFVDSDDFVDLDFCERMYKKAIETDSDVVCCPITYSFSTRESKKYFNKRKFGKNVREDGYILLKANSFAWNKIYRTEFWMSNGFEFPKQWYEDSALIYNVMLAANRVSCVNIPFYHYVKDREGSIVNTADERIFDIFKSTDSIISYYKEHDAFEELYDTVEHLCVRHIFGRIRLLHHSGQSELNRKFIEYAIDYLNRNFKDWRRNEFLQSRKDSRKLRKLYCVMVQHDFTLKRYASGERIFFDYLWDLSKDVSRWRKTQKKQIKKRERKRLEREERKRRSIQRYGLRAIRDVQTIMGNLGVVSFADFGTCLGIVREGGLLKHDLDIDIGVIADKDEQKLIRIAMERAGYKLWRQYFTGDVVAEDSYLYRNIKIDFNYYRIEDGKAKTLLFYRKPDVVYTDNTRHIVEMTYTAIKGVKEVEVNGVKINIPDDPETLMEEKYGPSWRTPDTGWIYWESPAAQKLDEKGYYITYKYQKIKDRTRETPSFVLVRNNEDGSINYDRAHACTEKGYDAIVVGTKEEKDLNDNMRVRVYVGDIEDEELIEKIRRRKCGDGILINDTEI